MPLLENQHRPQSHRALSAPTDIDSELLGPRQKLVSAGIIKRDKCSLALPAQIRKLAGVLLPELLQLAIQILAHFGGMFHEPQPLDLANDGFEQKRTRRVAHPRVELSVGLVWSQLRVPKVITRRLRLLGKGNHVGRILQVPVVVRPELARGADARLDFVDDHQHVVLLGDGAQAAEEGWRGVVVASLGLDRLHHDGGGRDVVGGDEALDLVEGGLFSGGVFLGVLVQGVLQGGESGLWPVKGGDVELVDGLGTGGGEGAEEAAVETGLEGEDGKRLGAGGDFVRHGGLHLLGGELDVRAAALLLPPPHEGSLVGRLVGVGAGHGREDLVETFGSNLEDTGFESGSPVGGREVAEGGPVNDAVDHGVAESRVVKDGVVVADGNGGDLGVAEDYDVVSILFSHNMRARLMTTYTSSSTLPSGSAM